MAFIPYSGISLAASLGLAYLGIHVFRKDSSRRLNRLVAFFTGIGAVWAFSEFMLRNASTPEEGLFWARATLSCLALWAPAFLHLTYEFPEERRFPLWVYLTGAAVVPWLWVSDAVRGIEFLYYGADMVRGSGYAVLAAYGLPVFALAVGRLLVVFGSSVGTRWVQMRYLLLASILGGAALVSGNLQFWIPDALPLGTLLALAGTFLAVHGIFRAGLFVTPLLRAHIGEVIQSMAEGLIVCSPGGDILYVNRAACRMLGYEEKELVGRPAAALFRGQEGGEPRPPDTGLAAVLPQGAARLVERTCVSKDGREIPVLLSATAMRDLAGRSQGAVLVVEDITERKRAEQEKDAMLQELQRLDQAKDYFLSITSHELRTPLAVIHGYASLLEDGTLGALAPNQREKVRAMLEQVERLNRMVRDFLDINAIRLGRFTVRKETVEMVGVVQAAVDSVEPLARERGVRFTVGLPPRLPRVLGDRERLSNVLLNLLTNAIKYTTPGGTVALSAAEETGGLHVKVSDMGIGIPEADLPRLFDRFYQVEGHRERREGGIGLGLAICKGIVEAHGGRIWARSEGGKGTTIHFILPVAEDRPPGPPDAGPARQSPP